MQRPNEPMEDSPHPKDIYELADWVRKGASLESAAAGMGISTVRLSRWQRIGKQFAAQKNDPIFAPFVTFCEAIHNAQMGFETDSLEKIKEARDWKATAWLLERKYPAKYAKQVTVTIQEEISKILDKLERFLPTDIYEQVLVVITMSEEELTATPPQDEKTPCIAGETETA